MIHLRIPIISIENRSIKLTTTIIAKTVIVTLIMKVTVALINITTKMRITMAMTEETAIPI